MPIKVESVEGTTEQQLDKWNVITTENDTTTVNRDPEEGTTSNLSVIATVSDAEPMNEDPIGSATEGELNDLRRDEILDCVARSDGFFKSQQRGEKDLDFDEKRKIAEEILAKNTSLFLKRYAKFLHADSLSYFEPYRGDYEVNFYLMEAERMLKKNGQCIQVKNRRYEALQRLIKEGSYFSDKAMQERSPLLYEQMIGRFMTEKEITELNEEKEFKFSSFLMKQMEKNRTNAKRQQEEDEEDDAWEESDSDSESEMEDEPPTLSSDEKQRFRNEFMSVMYEQFLSGKDKEFDYRNVDGNADYDDIQIRSRDEEERYFDSEEPD